MTTLYTPVYEALDLASAMLCDATDSLTANGSHWQQAPEGTLLPFQVWQSQDRGGTVNLDTIGTAGWTGLMTARTLDKSLTVARAIHRNIPAALVNIPPRAGFDISVSFDQIIDVPVSGGVWTAATQYRVTLRRTGG